MTSLDLLAQKVTFRNIPKRSLNYPPPPRHLCPGRRRRCRRHPLHRYHRHHRHRRQPGRFRLWRDLAWIFIKTTEPISFRCHRYRLHAVFTDARETQTTYLLNIYSNNYVFLNPHRLIPDITRMKTNPGDQNRATAVSRLKSLFFFSTNGRTDDRTDERTDAFNSEYD